MSKSNIESCPFFTDRASPDAEIARKNWDNVRRSESVIYNFGKLSKLREDSCDIVEKLKILIMQLNLVSKSCRKLSVLNFVSCLLHRNEIIKRAECICGCLERLYVGFLP